MRRFGESVSLDGNLVLIGASGSADLPVSGAKTGASYLFQNDGSDNWTQIAKFTAANARPKDNFAFATLISNQTLFISDPTVHVNASTYGAIDAFEENDQGQWIKKQSIAASSPAAGLGDAIAATACTLLATGSAYMNGGYQAVVFVFNKDALGTWNQTAQIVPPDLYATTGYSFGSSLAIEGAMAVIGDSGVGAAHIYRENADYTWQLIDTLVQDNPNPGFSEDFGDAVALKGFYAVVGAPSDGRQNGAYVFQTPEPSTITLVMLTTFSMLVARRPSVSR